MIRVLESLNNLKNKPDLSLLLLRQVKHQHHVIRSYSTAVGTLCSSGQEKTLGSLFRELIGSTEHPHVEVLSVLRSLPKRAKLEEALAGLKEMEESGITPDASTCRTLIEGLCLHGKTSSGYGMLQACTEKGIQISASGYNVVLRAYCNEARMKEADHILQEMRNNGVTPNTYTYSCLIHGYCKSGNISRALSLHDEMLSKGVRTNCVILSSILQCVSGMDMNDKAEEQFQRFKNSSQRKWGFSLLLSFAIDLQNMDSHMRQLWCSGIADTYLEARDRARRSSK